MRRTRAVVVLSDRTTPEATWSVLQVDS